MKRFKVITIAISDAFNSYWLLSKKSESTRFLWIVGNWLTIIFSCLLGQRTLVFFCTKLLNKRQLKYDFSVNQLKRYCFPGKQSVQIIWAKLILDVRFEYSALIIHTALTTYFYAIFIFGKAHGKSNMNIRRL